MRPGHPTLTLVLLLACTRAAGPSATRMPTDALPACEWCGAAEAPRDVASTLVMPASRISGEPMVIEGTVFTADGRTPAAGVLLYAYHTNGAGRYEKHGDETGNARRHGHLRGWLRTGADGRYRIATVKPGAYPTGTEPAHVHMTVQPPGEPERYIDDVVFDDDPFLTAAHRERLKRRGGSGITQQWRDARGVLHALRDIHLGRP